MRALVPLALLAVSCAKGPKHALEGSLTEVMDLGYERVVAQTSAGAVAVRFVLPRGELSEDTVLEVSVDLADAGMAPSYDLAERLIEGTQRGTLTRNVLDDPRTRFPSLERGTLRLNGSLQSGASVTGELRATFENGIEAASGRTVFGTFRAEVP